MPAKAVHLFILNASNAPAVLYVLSAQLNTTSIPPITALYVPLLFPIARYAQIVHTAHYVPICHC